jgi:hypothetical protein
MKDILRTLCLGILFLGMGIFNAQAKEWESLKGDHFVVYYRANVAENFVQTVIESAEEEFRRVLENLGLSRYDVWATDQKVSIYVYSDENDYITNGGQAGWSHGAAVLATRSIKTYPADAGFFDAILPHELGHMVIHEYLGPYVNIPLFFDEGVAMYQEKAKHVGARKIVQDALENGQFIPLKELIDMRLYNNSKQETVALFYAESASLVYFMITQLGEGHFYRFIRELKDDTKFVDALTKVYMNVQGIDDLNKRWVSYLKGD